MRFLFGLFAGALITLLVATALDAPTDHVVNQGVEVWTDTVARFHAAQQQLQDDESGNREVVTEEVTKVQAHHGADTGTEAASSDAAHEPVVAADATAPPAPQTRPDDPAAPAQKAAAADPSPPDQLPAVEADTSAPLDTQPATSPTPAELTEVVAWTPFHSEASAKGFAARLTSHLGHPFTVKRKGPAQYLVTYEYTDETDRSELEQQIAYVTGAAAP